MQIIVVKDKEAMGKRAAELVAAEMEKKPHFVLGLATGSSPLSLYEELIRMNKAGEIDFSATVTFNLDEYVGLTPDHSQSYRYFMNQHLFDHININKRNTHVPNGMAEDIEAVCEEYERNIADVGGIDVQILGIGSNGHIGFDEPGSSLGSLTRIKTLTESTRKDNTRFFDSMDDVPKYAITMGIGSILNASKVILLACGSNKADAVAKSLEGPVTSMVPASALQLHRFATFVVTEDAATEITLPYET